MPRHYLKPLYIGAFLLFQLPWALLPIQCANRDWKNPFDPTQLQIWEGFISIPGIPLSPQQQYYLFSATNSLYFFRTGTGSGMYKLVMISDGWRKKSEALVPGDPIDATVFDKRIYFLYEEGSAPNEFFITEYDPETDAFGPRVGLGAMNGLPVKILGTSNRLMAFVPDQSEGGKTTLYTIDPSSGSLSPSTPLNRLREGFAAAAVGDNIYLIGGYSFPAYASQGIPSDEVNAYSISKNTWSEKPPLSLEIANPVSAVVQDKIYIFDGANGYVFQFDPVNELWKRKSGNADILTNSNMRVAAHGDFILVCSEVTGETGQQVVYVYYPWNDN